MSNPPLLQLRDVLPARDGYDRWAAIYDREDNPLIALEERHLPPLIGDVRGRAIADVGCGTGRHAIRLAAAGATVTAIDFSEAMLHRATSKPGAERVRFVCHDLTHPLPLADGSYDGAISCLVLEHIPNLPAFFGELRRTVRRDGFLAASAMHPAMMLRGISARFTDPQTGRETRPQSYPHQIADFVNAAIDAGWRLNHMGEHFVDQALADASPRAAKYLGWPLLLLLQFTAE